MGNAVIFNGNSVKALKNSLILGTQATIWSGSTDPTSVATAGTIGDLYIRTGTPDVYQKITTSGTDTNWSVVNGSASAITALTSDVSATGPGSAAATVNSVGGSSAANVHSAELAANAATDTNTNSTIVKRDGSGNFSATTITASLTGTASGNLLKSSGDIDQTSFSIANNQSSPASVTGLAFANATNRAAKVFYSITINATSSLYEAGELTLIQQGSNWQMSQTTVGDNSLVVLQVTASGQVQYTSANYSGFTSGKMQFRAISTLV